MIKEMLLSKRVQKLRKHVMEDPWYIGSERARLVTEAYRMYDQEPVVLKRARALEHVLKNLTIHIGEGELIVGAIEGAPHAVPFYPESSVEWLDEELDGKPYHFHERPGDRYIVSDDVRRDLKEIIPYWRGKTHYDRVVTKLPEEIVKASEQGVINGYWLLHMGGEGHQIPGHREVLERGLRAVIGDARDKIDSLDLSDPDKLRALPFLQAVCIACEAVIGFASRYAELALDTAKTEKDAERREELRKIAEICARVPEHPASTLHEALQSVYLTHAACVIEDCPAAISYGCMDRYLFPFYESDMQKGKLTRDEALELIQCFLIKANDEKFILNWPDNEFFLGIGSAANLTLGGQTGTGEDASNDMSYLILEAQTAVRVPWPILTARYHDRTPEKFLMACIDVISLGGGQPGIFSDEVIIPAMMRKGFSYEDAAEYGIVGCVEPHVGGKQANRNQAGPYINLLKILELTLNGGRDSRTGYCLCPGDGDLATLRSFDEVMEAFRKQLRYYQKCMVINQHLINISFAENLPKAFNSALVKNCIRNGKAISEGGAMYDLIGDLEIGYANVGNALAAVRKLVFDDHSLTGEQLKHALDTNFEDMNTAPTGEEIRRMCVSAPKYGNGDDYADLLVSEVQRFVSSEIVKYKNTRCTTDQSKVCGYQPSSSTVSANIPFGKFIDATPDGRKSGEPTADGVSPHMGTDTQGPTGVAMSVGKLPNVLVSGGQLLNQKFSVTALAGEGKRKLASWIRTYEGDLKGMHVQFNVVDEQTLRDAQENPKKHRDLLVRVAGYTAYFTTLNRELQDVIIARTEQSF